MEKLVSIIIPNWNGIKDTQECLESLKNLDYSNYEIIIVDNGSEDDSVEILNANYPLIKVIENEANLGFAKANNQGILEARGYYILLLNNDTVVDKRFLSELVKTIEINNEIGIVGPKMYYYDDPHRLWAAGGGRLNWYTGRIKILGRNESDDGQYDETKDVDFIAGCALLTKKALFKRIGCLNEKYFAYYEDTDWCIRANENGYKSVYVPTSKIWHKVSASAINIGGFYRYYNTRNRFWFLRNHKSSNRYLIFLIYFFIIEFWLDILYFVKNNQEDSFKCFLKGIKSGLKS